MAEQKKRRKNRQFSYKTWIVPALVFVLFAVAGCLVMTSKVTTIKVEGNTHYSDDDVVDMLFPDEKSKNSVYCYWNHRFGEKKEVPLIESYEMNFEGANTVEIIIYEKSIVGCIEYMGSYMYFDKDGLVVESAPTKEIEVPLITGLTFHKIVLYQTLPVPKEEVFEEILNLTQLLYLYEIPAKQLQYDAHLDTTLTMADRTTSTGEVLQLANVRVLLGNRQNMEEKVAELKNQMGYLSGLSGVLHLETYNRTDLNPQFIFEKD
ncbi:MAG: cell division protein FtsQ [Lachnospiraceae bacterium]|nr:cell division protein FtsQ [Lachnospiraceae bacterium]